VVASKIYDHLEAAQQRPSLPEVGQRLPIVL
jgi:hypothetical protein